MELPDVPRAQRVYGQVVYWVCVAAAVACTVAPVLALTFPHLNVMNPYFLFASIWRGNTPEQVWDEVAGGFPGAHFWLERLGAFDGVMQCGLVLGCISALVGLVASAAASLRDRPLQIGWLLVALAIVVQGILAALGVYNFA